MYPNLRNVLVLTNFDISCFFCRKLSSNSGGAPAPVPPKSVSPNTTWFEDVPDYDCRNCQQVCQQKNSLSLGTTQEIIRAPCNSSESSAVLTCQINITLQLWTECRLSKKQQHLSSLIFWILPFNLWPLALAGGPAAWHWTRDSQERAGGD